MYWTEHPVLTDSVPILPLYIWVTVCFCMCVRLWGYVCSLWKPFCPLLHANALTMALALCAVLGQPADRKTGSNTGGGDLCDWSQKLFHLSSAMPAHTLMLHFPHAQGRESPQRQLSRCTLSVSLFQFCFNWFVPDRNTDQDKLSYALQYHMHPFSLMLEIVNMCVYVCFSRDFRALAECDCTVQWTALSKRTIPYVRKWAKWSFRLFRRGIQYLQHGFSSSMYTSDMSLQKEWY